MSGEEIDASRHHRQTSTGKDWTIPRSKACLFDLTKLLEKVEAMAVSTYQAGDMCLARQNVQLWMLLGKVGEA